MTASPEAASSDVEARMLSPAPALAAIACANGAHCRASSTAFSPIISGCAPTWSARTARLRYAVTLPIDLRVIIGRDNWLFLNGDGTIEQATGTAAARTRDREIRRPRGGAANAAAAKNARLLVAIPPNGSTINRFRLPAWAADEPAVSEYDLMMRALAARGVAAVDLRPPLLAANAVNPAYRRTDTHWNKLGALVAYNAVVERAARARLGHRSGARAARL